MDKQLILSRIISGLQRLRLHKTYWVKHPSRKVRYRACEIYQDALEDAAENNLFSEGELLQYLLETAQWSREEEDLFQELPKKIEDSKVGLFENAYQSKTRQKIRGELEQYRAALTELHAKRHAQDHLSQTGHALQIKNRYLLARSIYGREGPLFNEARFWKDTSGLLEEIQGALLQNRIPENQLRELARTEPWRSTYLGHKLEGKLFGISPLDYTEEQKSLVCWSQLYDNCYQNPDCPADDIVNDDDMFDGWLIKQRREREDKQLKKDGEDRISDLVKNCQEIYIPCQTVEDARKIEALNDPVARLIKAQRQKQIAEKGEVNEYELADTKARFRQEALAHVTAIQKRR